MSHVLQLQNLKTYSAPFTNGTILKKGEVIRVSDAVYDKIIGGGRKNLDGDVLPYWVEQEAGTKIDHDFAPDTVGLADSAAPAVAEAPKAAPAPTATKAAPAKRAASRQR